MAAPTFRGSRCRWWREGLVVINAAGGYGAFRVTDGKCTWFFPKVGARTVYGGQVYFVTMDEYYVSRLDDRCVCLQAPIRSDDGGEVEPEESPTSYAPCCFGHARVRRRYRGRLYAFERGTGEPVWKDKPEGITGFSGNIPVIAGNRLYIRALAWRLPLRRGSTATKGRSRTVSDAVMGWAGNGFAGRR